MIDKEKLLRLIARKYDSVKAFCEAYGISRQRLYKMADSEYVRRDTRKRMADFLKCSERERREIFGLWKY